MVTYEITVEGGLGPGWASWFDGMHVTTSDGETVIAGAVADQAALHGVLTKIRDLGLPLITVRRITAENQEERS